PSFANRLLSLAFGAGVIALFWIYATSGGPCLVILVGDEGAFSTRLLFAPLPAIIRTCRSLGSDQSRSPMTRVTRAQTPAFNPHTFLSEVGRGKTNLPSPNKHTIFSQGDAADAVFYIQAGKVKLTVVSQQGKEAVVAI